jgi:hypothetical protein
MLVIKIPTARGGGASSLAAAVRSGQPWSSLARLPAPYWVM